MKVEMSDGISKDSIAVIMGSTNSGVSRVMLDHVMRRVATQAPEPVSETEPLSYMARIGAGAEAKAQRKAKRKLQKASRRANR